MRYTIKIFFHCSLITLLFILSGCSNDPVSSGPYDGLERQNFDVVAVQNAVENLRSVTGMKSFVIGRGGEVAYETYFNDGAADSIHDVRSVTKSVMALLMGITIRDQVIDSVDHRIGPYLEGEIGENIDLQRYNITVRNLLTMSSGLEWHELDGGNSYSKWINSTDPINWVLEQPFIHDPGNGFNYNTGSIHLLSVILSLASNKSALEFAREKFFQPLAIKRTGWTVIKRGKSYNNGGAGLQISPKSMFLIGNLMLNDGVINGVQIVPREWVIQCKTKQNSTNGEIMYGNDYGFLWWVGNAHGHDLFYANGYGGQFIICVPDLDLVMVATCHWSGYGSDAAGFHWYTIYTTLMDGVLTAVND